LHLGFNSYIVGSINCPPISSEDILIVASSSGETSSVKVIVEIAKRYNADIITITANPESTIAKLSSRVVFLPATSTIKTTKDSFSISKQPMKTLFEQSLFILLESMVLQAMDHTKQKADDLAKRHTNLE
ncbi:MAG: SIS domain-containing protein, partial [Promethearchaeota archaeon]